MQGWLNNPWFLYWTLAAVLYILMCLFYAYDKLFNRGSWQDMAFSLLLSLLLPVVGFVILMMMDMRHLKRNRPELSDIFESTDSFGEDFRVLRPMDREQEKNRAPFLDKLTLNSYEMRRRAVMDTVTEGFELDYLEVLRAAMQNEDAETSHYASSIMMMLESRMQSNLVPKQKAWESNPRDMAAAREYEQALYDLLSSELLDPQSNRRYQEAYQHLTRKILAEEKPDEALLLHISQNALRSEDYSTASTVLDRYLELYPESEDAVYLKLCTCIASYDRAGFDAFRSTLGSRPVRLGSRTLSLIRFLDQPSARGASL